MSVEPVAAEGFSGSLTAGVALEDGTGVLLDELVALRRELHAVPEVGLDLPVTTGIVLGALEGLDLEVTTGTGSSWVAAVLRGAHPGPVVALRADTDALPITEDTGLEFASANGAMHACGHDLHTAALVGAARLLHAGRESLHGNVLLLFQPGEEGHGGARAMLAEGALEVAGPVSAAYALHVIADLPHGVFLTRPGPIMAAYTVLEVTVTGRGGHGGRPHEGLDAIPVAAQVVSALHTHVDRAFDAFDPVVLTVGQFNAGSAPNVVAERAVLRAGVRTFSEATTARVALELPRVAERVAAAFGATAEVVVREVMAPTVNDPASARVLAATATALFGPERYAELANPRTGSEDFSEVLRRVPGAYGYLGAAAPGAVGPDRRPAGNHSPRAFFDDSLLGDAARLLAGLARHHLVPGALTGEDASGDGGLSTGTAQATGSGGATTEGGGATVRDGSATSGTAAGQRAPDAPTDPPDLTTGPAHALDDPPGAANRPVTVAVAGAPGDAPDAVPANPAPQHPAPDRSPGGQQ
ncbi:M20 metallopeptidase family protein [Actinosynnema pretiosum]|uniref:Amidohydrolase n=1 Tax=Actinosynnema pretiosum TaxID=42197 RepID=A0A290Z5M9_9PSEU|nr:M20 family metallopeptidase [Actinosynnema pretiosum]ATE54330.1 amidohydrolase [Actinosynnema pretiosum]